ncbi:general secretion pathway protein GspK [Acetobacter sp. TBRC 12305]|uniref:General secretion pathway protein GspK n=1 Tax=Acetobacter garciniae TaxID=2817435 RepID=A0A939HP60_9PROT|nr:type II secretion system protein GspK [Acetobacter garciniae]MBO1325132.1 general secretion pathway protein GspK [Acetobacter garciniae]MBX0344897.1 general secretion pathway protein GspK [Acetobacter garciniae]
MAAQPGRKGGNARGQGGFALLIVLWTLVGLSLLVSVVLAVAGSALRGTSALRGAAQVQALAEGEIWDAVFHALDRSPARWAMDGRAYTPGMQGAAMTVRLFDEAGLVNPNTAPRALLVALLHGCGATPAQAADIAANMAQWRSSAAGNAAATRQRYLVAGRGYSPPYGAFQSVEELGLVLGMTPRLLQALRPHLSLTQPNDPDIGLADPVVRQALREAGLFMPHQPLPGEVRPRSFVVLVDVRDTQGYRAMREATILLTPAAGTLADGVHVVRIRTPDGP